MISIWVGQTRLIARHWPGKIISFSTGRPPSIQPATWIFSRSLCRTPLSSETKFIFLLTLCFLHWGFALLLLAWWIRLGRQLGRRLRREGLPVNQGEQLFLPLYHLTRNLAQNTARGISGGFRKVLWL